MKTFGRPTAAASRLDTQAPRTAQMVPARTCRVRRLIDALQSLDDRTLSQIGIERCEIERFAQTEVAHRV